MALMAPSALSANMRELSENNKLVEASQSYTAVNIRVREALVRKKY